MALARFGRRPFLQTVSSAALAWFLPRPLAAAPGPRPILVCVNMVGGLDGSSVLVPYAEDAYYRARPSISVPPPGRPRGALPLCEGFGLHPKLAPLYELYLEERLAIVPAAGGANFGRSHFSARDALHRAPPAGTAHDLSVRDGWANRYAGARASDGRGSCLFSTTPELPPAMAGDAPANMAADRSTFATTDGDSAYLRALERLYAGSSDPFARSASRALSMTGQVHDRTQRVRLRGKYSKSGRGLRDAARLVVADVGAEIIWVQLSGFDTHKSQGGVDGSLAQKLAALGQDLAAFRKDIGGAFSNVTVVTLTEFGRTLAETGAGGTDHGAASCMLVLGGSVCGGRLAGPWPGFDGSNGASVREVIVATDYRAVLAEVLTGPMGLDAKGINQVFPGWSAGPALGLYDKAS